MKFTGILLLLSASCFAQIGGNGVYSFLSLPNSARALALGGEAIAFRDDDVNLAYQNPASINTNMHNRLSSSFVDYFAGINYGLVSYARNYKKGTWSTQLHYVDYGTFDRADEFGNLNGTFTASDACFSVGYAQPIDSLFSVGVNFKNIFSSLENYSSYGMAFDLGGFYTSKDKLFQATFLVRNVGFQLKTYNPANQEPIQWQAMAGIVRGFEHIPLKFSVVLHNLQQWDLLYNDPAKPLPTRDALTGDTITYGKRIPEKLMSHIIFGAEVEVTKGLFIRAGYNYWRRQQLKVDNKPGTVGFSWGVGLKISKFVISYARSAYHLAGSPNYFTLSANLNEFYKK